MWRIVQGIKIKMSKIMKKSRKIINRNPNRCQWEQNRLDLDLFNQMIFLLIYTQFHELIILIVKFESVMKSHSEKYFTEALQICAFFKYHTKRWEDQISEAIKLMTIDELYANIANTQYETKLVKEIIIFLIQKAYQPKFIKNRIGSAIHYLEGALQEHRKEIVQNYYLQLALQQYISITNSEQNVSGYAKVFNFYELETELKFNLLCTLIENVLLRNTSPSKIKNQELDQTKNQQKKGKNSKKILQQLLILGQDNKYVYFFASFQPAYVLTLYMGKWGILTKNDVKQRIKNIVNQPKNPNLLFLGENLGKIYSIYMEEPKNTILHIRLHKVFQTHNERKRVQILKQKLLEINFKYNFYLTNFGNRCWGYLPQRQNYEKRLKAAQSMAQLIEALKQFFLVSKSKIYVIKTIDESKIPKQEYGKFYTPQTRYYCNINTVSTKIAKEFDVQSEEISKKMLQQNRVDRYALLQINVIILEKAVLLLDQKAKKYFEKIQKQQSIHQSKSESNQTMKDAGNNDKKRILRDRSLKGQLSSLSSIEDSEADNSMKTTGMNLRQRKKKNNKFGVRMIDSDESQNQSQKTHQFNKYEYKTRSVANK